ncbi:MAG: helix-turn-helix transcriptional regulator [Clostridiales bacterium]|nr:helix-turn-helix transcriptional regulator [Clostridiales bacterium]
MMMNYEKLFSLLDQKNIKPSHLTSCSLITADTLKRLKDNGNVTLYTLEKISAYIGCEIWDLFTYTPE